MTLNSNQFLQSVEVGFCDRNTCCFNPIPVVVAASQATAAASEAQAAVDAAATSAPASAAAAADAATNAAANTFTKANSVFVGWNTAADGSGIAYAKGKV